MGTIGDLVPEKVRARAILVIKLGSLGDVVQSEGALRDIREHHQGARITILTGSRYRALMERCPWIDDVMVDPRAPRLQINRLWQLRRQLKERAFDMVYDLQNNRRTSLYYRWMRVPWSGRAAGYRHPIEKHPGSKTSALEVIAGQLRAAGLQLRHTTTPDISWMGADVSALLTAAGLSPGFILLVPGSSARHPQKRWPHYAALAERLIAAGHRVATAPGPDELSLCRTIPGDMLLDNGQPLDIFQLVGLSRQAAYVIGNDTGPTHVAAYAGTSGLAIFGPHTHAAATHIDRRLKIISAQNLQQLSADEVYAVCIASLPASA
jgi:ADP-heptose:LPS heptosyltransferase